MKPSEEQQAVIDHVRDSKSHLVVDARAGSGKTSTLVNAINELPVIDEVLCLAFNKRIAEELQDRMPGNADCRTLNSLGHRAWMKYLDNKVEMEFKKGFKLLDWAGVELEHCPDILRLVDLAKANGLVPTGCDAQGLIPDTVANWNDLIDSNDLDMGQVAGPVNLARGMLGQSIKMALNGVIDFNDQLYMPTLWGAKFPVYDAVMVDEAQDLSLINHAQLRAAGATNSKLIAVGDRYQAIYAFRGADSGSIPKIEKEWKTDTLPMTISFRCPTSVIYAAQEYVTDIRPRPSAPPGLVAEEADWGSKSIRNGDVILCRNTKPLVSLCFSLIKTGKNAKVLGRDIGQNLVTMVKKMKRKTVADTLDRLEVYRVEHGQYLRSRNKETQAELLTDKADCIGIIAQSVSPHAVTSELIKAIERIFSAGKAPITLSTIHKAKGMEWKRVWFLDKYLIPSKYARTAEALQQESNIAYVGMTRALEELHFVDSRRYVG